MDRFFSAALRLAFSTILAAGCVSTASRLIIEMQRDAKHAMKMGMSYGKFNRQLVGGKSKCHQPGID